MPTDPQSRTSFSEVPTEAAPQQAPSSNSTDVAHTDPPTLTSQTKERVSNTALQLLALTGVLLLALGSISLLGTESPVRIDQTAAVSAAITDAFAAASVEAKAAYVFDIAHERVLFAKNENVQLPLASITKMALILVAAEVIRPDETLTISREAVEKGEGGLTMGEEWRAQDLMDLTLVASSNVGAEALGEAADKRLRGIYPTLPEEDAIVARMNALASELGLTQTFFMNASGLDVSPTQASAFGSARDIAMLAAYAARSAADVFAHTSLPELQLGPSNGHKIPAVNTNIMLKEVPGLILGKTGTTDLAGGNLAIVFELGPARPIAAVVLGSTADGRFDDMRLLIAATHRALGTVPPKSVE